jgi:putative membrane protein
MHRSVTLAALLLVSSFNAFAAESRSHEFIKEAIEGNLFEVKAGEMAQQKAASAGVRQFGAMLAKDHANAATKAMSAAKTLGLEPPKSPGKTQQGVLEAMSRLEGEKFDDNFIKSMADDHLRDVARYEAQSKANDAASKYAAETLPTLREHLKTVQGLQNERSTR